MCSVALQCCASPHEMHHYYIVYCTVCPVFTYAGLEFHISCLDQRGNEFSARYSTPATQPKARGPQHINYSPV